MAKDIESRPHEPNGGFDVAPVEASIAAYLTPEEQQVYYGRQLDLRKFKLERGPSRLNAIEGYTGLAPSKDNTQHLPYLPSIAVLASDQYPANVGVPGRIIDIRVPTETATGGGYRGEETMSVLDPEWAPGRVYADMQALQAEAKGEYNHFRNMSYCFGIFAEDPTARHPLHEDAEMYKHEGDFRLVTVMTNIDADPTESYIHTFQPSDNGVEPQSVQKLLSMEAEGLEAHIREQFGEANFEKSLQKIITTFGNIHSTLFEYATAGEKDISFEGILEKTYTDNKVDDEVKGFIRTYIETVRYDLWALRIPCRAAAQLNDLREFESSLGRKVPKEVKGQIQDRRGNIYKEVIQALSKAYCSVNINNTSEYRQGANPLRWEAFGYDEFDINWAHLMSAITAGEYSPIAQAVAQRHEGIPQQTQLIITPTGGNSLQVGMSLKNGESSPGNVVYESGEVMPFKAVEGAFPVEVIRSVYDKAVPLMADGFVAKIDVQAPDIQRSLQRSQRFLVVDLMRMAGKVLRQVDTDLHAFNSSDSSLPYNPKLSDLLDEKDPDPKLAVVQVAPNGHIYVNAVIADGEGVQLIRTANTARVRMELTRVVKKPANAHQAKQGLIKRVLGFDSPEIQIGHEMAANPIKQNEVAIAGIALFRGRVHAAVSGPTSADSAKVSVMRSQKRAQTQEKAYRM